MKGALTEPPLEPEHNMDKAKFETDLEKLTAVYIEGAKAPLQDMLTDLESDAAEPPLTIAGCRDRFRVYARELKALLTANQE